MGPVTSPTGLRVRHFKDPERNLIGVAGSCNDAHLSCGLGRGLEDRRGTQRRRRERCVTERVELWAWSRPRLGSTRSLIGTSSSLVVGRSGRRRCCPKMLLVDGSLTRAAGTGSPPGTWPISEPWSWASTSPRRCSPTRNELKTTARSASPTSVAMPAPPSGGTARPSTGCCPTWRSWTSTTWTEHSLSQPQSRALAVGSIFPFSDPCYPGGPEGSFSGLSRRSPDLGYSQEGWWSTQGDGVRGRVGANHRMLSTYLNSIIRSGFSIEEFAELGGSVPVTLVVRALRQS